MNLASRRELRHRFWLGVAAGASSEAAAMAAGVSPRIGSKWFGQAGGVIPSHLLAQPSGHYLSFAEREEIFAGVERGESIRSMARRLGRAPSTVLRELRRNMPHQYRTRSQLKPGADLGRPRTQPWDYRPSLAQRRADQRAARPKPARLAQEGRLREEVQERLEDKMSPEQIVAHLRHQFDDPGMWVSHETIYQSIYVQGRGALRRQLASCLRTGRALRQPQRRSNQRRPRTPNMINISERPAEVQDRALPGHWEGDLIMGKGNRSAIGTLVERSTRFVMLLHLPNGHQAEAVQEAMIAATQRLPQTLWKSLTWDQGVEMSNHAQISAATDLDIYFCDPHSPWQRGSNENTNGLLRQYFPKGTDLSVHSLEHLRFVEAQMNRRIRKTLNWLSPAQALDRLLSTTSHPPGVATTT